MNLAYFISINIRALHLALTIQARGLCVPRGLILYQP